MLSEVDPEWVPLSQCALWAQMGQEYAQHGPLIWSQIPCMVTNTPFLAEHTADLILSSVSELIRSSAADIRHPIYILELGAGLGRFGYYLLKRLVSRRGSYLDDRVQIVYVLSDRVEKNVAFWRQHSLLKPFVAMGLLDFACFDFTGASDIQLIERQSSLALLRNPLILVANYVLDSLPQDYYKVVDHQLFLGHVPASTRIPEGLPGNSYVSMAELGIETEYRPRLGPDVANALDQVLEQWRLEMEEGYLLFPTALLEGLSRIRERISSRLILLVHDKGFSKSGDLHALNESGFTSHGLASSLVVDYRSIARFCALHGGESFHPSQEYALAPGSFTAGLKWRELPQTLAWLREQDQRFSPFDLVNLIPEPQLIAQLSFDACLTLIKISRFDPEVFIALAARIQELLPSVAMFQVNALLACFPTLDEHYFPTPVSGDLHLIVGTLYQGLGYSKEALKYFYKSLAIKGDSELVSFQLAAAFMQLGKFKKAELYLLRTIQHNPENITARGWLSKAREAIPKKHWARTT